MMTYEAGLLLVCVAGLCWKRTTLLKRTKLFFYTFCEEVGFPQNLDGVAAGISTAFSIQLQRPAKSALGIRVGTSNGKALIVQAIIAGGLFEQWNSANPAKRVRVGDRILSVNENDGDASTLVEELSKDDTFFDIVISHALPSSNTELALPLLSDQEATGPFVQLNKNKEETHEEAQEEPQEDMLAASSESTEVKSDLATSIGHQKEEEPMNIDSLCQRKRSSFDRRSRLNGCMLTLEPKPRVVLFKDPSSKLGHNVGVIGFHNDGKEEAWDIMCGSSFLGNFYDLSPDWLELEAPCDQGVTRTFKNAEAAFHALKFWFLAESFANLSGQAAVKKITRLNGHEDLTYGGFGNNWNAMWAVLNAKFQPKMPLAEALLKTGDAFLLKHDSIEGRDKVWSDNGDGEGINSLGIQLLLIRDQLSGETRWTDYIKNLINIDVGGAKSPSKANQWHDTVRRARLALLDELEKQ